ncbi:MAG TPA: chitosanase [Chthoniobacterales bacterium]|nr:chitosanase [Chthoniobacterales bacterium]
MTIPAPFDPKYVSFIRRILSVAETGKPVWDPAAVYVYSDDNRFNPARKQITLSIGFTEGGSNLKKLLQRYVELGGVFGAQFAPYIATMGSGPSLHSDSKFMGLLKQAGKEDPMMMKTQEEMFDKLYLGPAFGWAAKYGFGLPLSYLVIADSFLHSGSMLDFLMNRFPEKKPAAGGDSKVWITAYTKTRKDWLTSHSNSLLRNTVYRCNCYLIQIDKNNWDLEETPVVMHGTPVNYA